MPCYDVNIDSHKKGVTAESSIKWISAVMIGNPNVGKSSLFNELTGMNAKIANFPGTTVGKKTGRLPLIGAMVEVLDLPGVYSLRAVTAEEKIACDVILGEEEGIDKPDVALVVADASNIERSLFLISQVFEYDVPTIVVLNMDDIARKKGLNIDTQKLEKELKCPVIITNARSGAGIDALVDKIREIVFVEPSGGFVFDQPKVACNACNVCPFQARYTWSEQVAERCVEGTKTAWGQKTEKIDRILTHPIVGVFSFLIVMLSVFYLIFSIANIPMDLIDALFAWIGSKVTHFVPAGKLQSLLVDGVIGGVGGMLVFLPQICILFFFLALLEDSGYLSRAAFVMDRLMRKVGLPGTAFVPLLSAHACAIPAIMATRVIRDPRDRLVTILVAPLMTCSARIPVYAMVTALLFPNSPGKAAIVFTGAYLLGIVSAITIAFLFKKTILPGESKPLVLELPDYRIPRIREACFYVWDRAKVFIQQAGSIILAISIVLWILATFPGSAPSETALSLKQEAQLMIQQGEVEGAQELENRANAMISQEALSHSFAGRLGKLIEPVVEPLGFDWQIGIGVITSFAAREVIVSTLAIVYGVGEDSVEDNSTGLHEKLRHAKRSNGEPVFTMATSMSLLVFYVLAMQCLPTQAVTKRETNSIKWAVFQFSYMTILAYAASLLTFNIVTALGIT